MAKKDEKVSIYALCCPYTGAVRYIGKANSPTDRLQRHLRDSNRRDTPVYRWIRKLVANKALPEMMVLEVVEGDWREAERRLIAEYRGRQRLLNVADGGDEPHCSPSVRAENGRRLWAAIAADPIRLGNRNILRKFGQCAHEVREMGRIEMADKMCANIEKLRASIRLQPEVMFFRFAANSRLRPSLGLPAEVFDDTPVSA